VGRRCNVTGLPETGRRQKAGFNGIGTSKERREGLSGVLNTGASDGS
jgi:hypothetical protein